MSPIKLPLIGTKELANGTMEFIFRKPAGFEYRPGQYCNITLIEPPETDTKGDVRCFSFVSAPFEDHLSVATRLRDSAFKRIFRKLAEGGAVHFDAPYGSFTLHKNQKTPAVFIIGGIGVTPVRSMIAQATHDKSAHHITLIYSNKTPADAAFLTDFRKFASQNANFTFVPVASESAPADFIGERGHVDAAMIKRHVSDFDHSIFYLAGPPGMVKAMRAILVNDLKANEDNIRTEEFDGY